MYLLTEDIKIKNVGEASNKIGINISTLSRILHKKQKCSKIMAYCITKYINQEAEISDYFLKI